MEDQQPTATDQLHPNEQYDQTATNQVAPEAEVRSSADAGATASAGLGAVENEVTPMTPPSADTSSPEGKASADEDFDPADEIPGG